VKAKRNKTIDLAMEEGQYYLDRCVSVSGPTDISQIIDKTIIGDTFSVIPYIPNRVVDLFLIVDPPYNLDKDFHGNKYKKTSDDKYEEYTELWINLVLPILKDDATIYVCCDWKSSPTIGRVLKKYFNIQNRITRQRKKAEAHYAIEKMAWKISGLLPILSLILSMLRMNCPVLSLINHGTTLRQPLANPSPEH
jgi:site-specific DNA-methyltransferase (adenine-specific)